MDTVPPLLRRSVCREGSITQHADVQTRDLRRPPQLILVELAKATIDSLGGVSQMRGGTLGVYAFDRSTRILCPLQPQLHTSLYVYAPDV